MTRSCGARHLGSYLPLFSGLCLAILGLVGCQREAEGPLKLSGKVFIFNYRLAYATYVLALEKVGPVEEGMRVVARFQNPAGGEDLVTERKLFPKLDKVSLESPDVTCIRKGVPYRITINVLGPDGSERQRLETTLASTLDQDVLPARALVIGPAYEKNPDMFADGKAPAHFATMRCPAKTP